MKTLFFGLLIAAQAISGSAPAKGQDEKKRKKPLQILYEPSRESVARLDLAAARATATAGLTNMVMQGTDDKGDTYGRTVENVQIDRKTIKFRHGKNQQYSETVLLAGIDARVIYDPDADVLKVGPATSYAGKDASPEMYPKRGGNWTIHRAVKDKVEGAPTYRELADALLLLKFKSSMQFDPAYEDTFLKNAEMYRSSPVKPDMPEAARRFAVQAQVMVDARNFDRAIELYEQLLEVAPWLPDAHYNLARQLASAGEYAGAIVEAKRYLTLVPAAPDARVVQDLIYEWELKAESSQSAPSPPPSAAPRRGGA